MMSYLRNFSILTAFFVVAGCAPWSSYPPIETGGALLNPRYEPVPTLLARSIEYAHQHYGAGGAYTYALPVGMPDSLPKTLNNRLGADASFTGNSAAATYRVLQVRARGSEGEVDLTYRRPDGGEQMVTVTLHKPLPLEPFRVVHAKQWRIRADLLDDMYLARPEEAMEPVEPLDADETVDDNLPPTVPAGVDSGDAATAGANEEA